MLKTKVTKMLGIEYPIQMGTMAWLTRAELVAAAAEAGIFGCIPSASFDSPEELRQEIKKAKALTKKPIGVNISLFPMARPYKLEDMIDAALGEGIRIIETSGRSPAAYVERIKKGGATLLHKCARVRDVVSAERAGVDLVSIVGTECGGHPSMEDVTTMILGPMAVDAVKIPVLVGGGIADGRGLVAALAFGAEGVLMGTRFMVTKECMLHNNIKKALVEAKETDTAIIQRSIQNPVRVFKNKVAQQVLDMEAKGATLEQLMPLIGGERGKKAWEVGDVDGGVLHAGQVLGLIGDIPTVKQVVDRTVAEAEAVYKRLGRIVP